MDTFERDATRMLAIAYHAYMDARAANREHGIQVWAKLLITAQRDTGVELIPVNNLLYPMHSPAPTELTEAQARGIDDYLVKERRRLGRDDSDDGGALVPAPKPPPRKPSPGASVATQASAFYARRS